MPARILIPRLKVEHPEFLPCKKEQPANYDLDGAKLNFWLHPVFRKTADEQAQAPAWESGSRPNPEDFSLNLPPLRKSIIEAPHVTG